MLFSSYPFSPCPEGRLPSEQLVPPEPRLGTLGTGLAALEEGRSRGGSSNGTRGGGGEAEDVEAALTCSPGPRVADAFSEGQVETEMARRQEPRQGLCSLWEEVLAG